MNKILICIKKIIPKKLFKKLQPVYHYVVNFLAALFYGFPSNKMTVIGVTGTTGKTTVVYMTAKLLQNAGYKVGYTSTAMFGDGKKEWLNDKKMTMLGRFFTQKMLRHMVQNGCSVAIVETTSEGVVQYRHKFINYDVMLFTGLYPEHIDSHGSFENYKKAKLQLFEHVGKCDKKKLVGVKDYKTIIVNIDDKHAGDFLNCDVERKICFTQNDNVDKNSMCEFVVYKYESANKTGIKFVFENTQIQLKILGKFNAMNATAAGCVAKTLNISNKDIKKGLESIEQLPGRIERIEEGQDFTVIVDYAFEPVAVSKLYETISVLKPKKIIHVLGSTGGGRDVSRRSKLGKLAAKNASFIIITNEDPYDDDPMQIIEDVAQGAKDAGAKKDENLFLIKDRKKAIQKALSLANTEDVVLITGKGSEQAIATKDGMLIPWDDRKVVRELLKKGKPN
jgi:UDP-N-acetylmuramoyl-L-alanyl-D-glutamate--2,6-diaminopimelate ligase